MRHVLVLLGSVLSVGTLPALASQEPDLISEQEAITAALAEVGVEVLGIRFDQPDTQWDMFIRLNDTAYEIEVDAATGAIVAAEQESLAEIQAELSGDLSHEGVEGDVDP